MSYLGEGRDIYWLIRYLSSSSCYRADQGGSYVIWHYSISMDYLNEAGNEGKDGKA